MTRYLFRRVLYTIPIVFGVALLLFVLFDLVGGDPVLMMLGQHASPSLIADMRTELGLDLPKWQQFLNYLKQIVSFDYGLSYSTRQPISQMIARGIGPSLSLMIPAFLMTFVFSLMISLFAAYFHGRWLDRAIVFLCVLGISVSSLAFILFGQYVFAYKLGWFPISGYSEEILDRFRYVMMPAIIWMFVVLGFDVRFFRTAILDEINQDYVRTARAKGVSEFFVFFKHVLKNSLVPVLTYIVIRIPFLVMGSFLLESFFSIPGLGSITIDAINNSDFPVLKAMATVNALLFIFGNLITDILYSLVDPRVELR